MIRKVISGAQTGVDRGALLAAIELGIPHGGWVPKGRRAEDGLVPKMFKVTETELSDYRIRTFKNVRDSDATLILSSGTPEGGTRLTLTSCLEEEKDWLVLDIADLYRLWKAQNEYWVIFEAKINTLTDQALVWLDIIRPETLNVAGHRESKAPRIQKMTKHLLKNILSEILERV